MNAMQRDGVGNLWAMRSAEDLREIGRNMAALPSRIVSAGPDVRVQAESYFQAEMDEPRVQLAGSVAVVPVCGPIFNRGNLYSYFFGGAVISTIRAQVRKALADPDVKAILLRVDSPGGTVDGVPEFAAELLKARTIKPLLAISDTCMASAAYWLGASAEEIIASPSAFVGSIGVFYEHEVVAKMLELMGVEIELVASSPEKVEDHQTVTLSEEARAHKQNIVDTMATMFQADVARGRGITPAAVKADYGKGRAFLAGEAKRMGLVDRVATFEDTVSRLTGSGRRKGPTAEMSTEDFDAAVEDAVRAAEALALSANATREKMMELDRLSLAAEEPTPAVEPEPDDLSLAERRALSGQVGGPWKEGTVTAQPVVDRAAADLDLARAVCSRISRQVEHEHAAP